MSILSKKRNETLRKSYEWLLIPALAAKILRIVVSFSDAAFVVSIYFRHFGPQGNIAVRVAWLATLTNG